MKIDFILPDIGEGIVECELVEWHIQEGEAVAEDQPVADVMTDKALVEITAMHTGTITRHYWNKGDVAKVGKPLFQIEVSAEEAARHPEVTQVAEDAAPAAATEAVTAPTCSDQPRTRPGKALASPAVRRMARELELDLSQVQGSGRDGRVLKEDLLALQGDESRPAVASDDSVSRPAAVNRTVSIKGVQAAMARQMQDAYSSIPHFTYAEELDVTELEALRLQLRPEFEKDGLRLSLMPFMMKAIALAVQQYPLLNSRVNAECTEITYLADVNIGMAADTPMGLLVPNVKQVQHKSLKELAAEINRLTDAARQGKLPPDSMKGGSISISNIGVIGGTVATPIINKPEVAIVALGRIQQLPRFNSKGEVEARQILNVSWSGDHRVIDGATMARFCNLWKSYLEQPARMLVDLR
ncbi:2-oxo acid dehydrogenase subunit E2 [Marinospirillum alkaliphilum]|uniref:Dihydrolipoamide acetyltransferase component of pyruvate dehydrogenase complex n=1 Tax=Marinospirillum alkaliphilum DSM 21637 TaxID=1122209 RepID=A0A1K1XH67_9GAMM|nr:2-oxo acid dehydrogenase subunit E2 [Marinospirillum alkaliphilum]SFX48413.1 2-oxoisovalerate dehydrogenase E2 component (dihydrolipoyl transacylase) [Marinospirillum alkaliphilum DSM 21637]